MKSFRCIAIVLAAAAGSFFSAAALSCSMDDDAGQFMGDYRVTLAPGESRLLVLDQVESDLKIHVSGRTSFWLNAPAEKFSPDFVVLDEASLGQDIELCLHGFYRHSPQSRFSINEYDLGDLSPGEFSVIREFNSAGSLWLEGGDNMNRSAADYAAIAAARLPVLENDETLRFFTHLFPAMAYIKLRNFDQAVRLLTMLEAEYSPTFTYFYKLLLHHGRVLVRQGNWDEAIPLLEESLVHFERHFGGSPGSRFEHAEIQLFLSEAYTRTKQFTKAAQTLDAAEAEAEPDFALLGRIYNNRAALDAYMSDVPTNNREETLALYKQARDNILLGRQFAGAANDYEILQLIESNAGTIYAKAGEIRKAEAHYREAFKIMEENGLGEFLWLAFSSLGKFAISLGDYSRAEAYLQRSISLAEEAGGKPLLIDLCRLGTVFRLQEKLADAIDQHAYCLERAIADDSVYSQVDALLQLSIDNSDQELWAQAETRIREALTQWHLLDDANLKMQVRTQLASILLNTGRTEEAEQAINMALAIVIDDRSPNDYINAMLVALRIQRGLGHDQEAVAIGLQAIGKVETIHRQLEAERIGPSWSNLTSAVYSSVATIYLDRYRENGSRETLARALNVIERSRAISLRQRLGNDLPEDANQRESQRQLELYSKVSSLLADSTDDGPDIDIFEYYHRYDLLSLARLNDIEDLAIPEPLNVAEIQQKLRKNQLALYYFNTSDALFIFSITALDFQLKRLPYTAEINALLDDFNAARESPQKLTPAFLTRLSSLLLPDLTQFPDADELLVVKDVSLFALPISALSEARQVSEYLPLIEKYSLQNVPSLSVFFMDKSRREAAHSVDVAVLANPVFASPMSRDMEQSLAMRNAMRDWSENLPALAYSGLEADNIVSHFPDSSLSFTRARANRKNLVTWGVRNAKILHIATHAFFRSTSDDNIGLALSTIDDEGNPDPGFITLTELFGNQFNNELVVINACDTAMGKELAGVGLNSLARGFLAQGVKHVISTLWPVSDRATTEFMDLFYTHLKADGDIAQALRKAQLALSQNPSYRDPFYWAAYTLTATSTDDVISLTP